MKGEIDYPLENLYFYFNKNYLETSLNLVILYTKLFCDLVKNRQSLLNCRLKKTNLTIFPNLELSSIAK